MHAKVATILAVLLDQKARSFANVCCGFQKRSTASCEENQKLCRSVTKVAETDDETHACAQ